MSVYGRNMNLYHKCSREGEMVGHVRDFVLITPPPFTSQQALWVQTIGSVVQDQCLDPLFLPPLRSTGVHHLHLDKRKGSVCRSLTRAAEQ